MSTSTAEPNSPSAPQEVLEAIERVKDELIRAAGGNLLGLALFGGLARGSYHREFSDVNLLVLLAEANAEQLEVIGPVLRRGFRSARIEPLVLTPRDAARMAELFPTKWLDIQERHRILHGGDFLGTGQVSPERVRLRIEQELCNMLLRLRRRFVAISDDPQGLAMTLASAARPLAIELDALLRLTGKPRSTDDSTAAIFSSAADGFGLDSATLQRLAALRRDQSPPSDAAALFGQVLATIDAATKIAASERT
jgi:predicted nucleotidyltransferase